MVKHFQNLLPAYCFAFIACSPSNAPKTIKDIGDSKLKTLVITDTRIITGLAIYDPETLDFFIAFPERFMAVNAAKPPFYNNDYQFVFHFNNTDTGSVFLFSGNRVDRTKSYRYIDTTIQLKSLSETITMIEISRALESKKPDKWKPELKVKENSISFSKDMKLDIVLDYAISSDSLIYFRSKSLKPSRKNFEYLQFLLKEGIRE